MDHVPAQDEDYRNRGADELTVMCAQDVRFRVVYLDWEGVQQERLFYQGRWQVRTRMLKGYRFPEPDGSGGYQWSALRPLSELGLGVELSVGTSLEAELPKALRRGR